MAQPWRLYLIVTPDQVEDAEAALRAMRAFLGDYRPAIAAQLEACVLDDVDADRTPNPSAFLIPATPRQ